METLWTIRLIGQGGIILSPPIEIIAKTCHEKNGILTFSDGDKLKAIIADGHWVKVEREQEQNEK